LIGALRGSLLLARALPIPRQQLGDALGRMILQARSISVSPIAVEFIEFIKCLHL
jgi:hypothetical protein